jgi:hypothetical protein
MGYSRVSISYRGMGEYLRSSGELRSALLSHAEVGSRYAKGIAPVGPLRDPRRHEFRDSIRAETFEAPGGYIAARIVARPIWVEFGRRRINPYRGAYVLRRTGQYLNAPKRRA